jgi:hypothetical protein
VTKQTHVTARQLPDPSLFPSVSSQFLGFEGNKQTRLTAPPLNKARTGRCIEVLKFQVNFLLHPSTIENDKSLHQQIENTRQKIITKPLFIYLLKKLRFKFKIFKERKTLFDQINQTVKGNTFFFFF